jgi:hypothetical protein
MFLLKYNIHIFSVDFALKVLQWSDSEMVRLQLWDIAGKMGKPGSNKGRNYLPSKLFGGRGEGGMNMEWQS